MEETAVQRRLRPHPRLQLQFAIFVGGIAGALARAGLVRAFPFHGHGWPWATFVANVVGVAALGYLITRLQERLPPSTFRRPLLGTGFCGALTTFSTFQLELIRLVRHGEVVTSALYLVVSLAAGLGIVYVASALTRRVTPR